MSTSQGESTSNVIAAAAYFTPFLHVTAKWSTSPAFSNRAETPPGTGSLLAFAGSSFGSFSTDSGQSLSRTGTAHPATLADFFGETYTAARPGSVGIFTLTAGRSAVPGPAKPMLAVCPRCAATGKAVVAPENSPMRRR